MIAVIDNYDSFTYNLAQYLNETALELALNDTVEVFRNDEISLDKLRTRNPTKIIISPGPGHPSDAGISNAVIRNFSERIPILGVCLGHQCLGQIYGANIIRSVNPIHGKTAMINHDGKTIFRGLPNPFVAARYHSLTVDKNSIHDPMEISAWTSEGEIMGLRIKHTNAEGVQFHPESILTSDGKKIIKNFLLGCE